MNILFGSPPLGSVPPSLARSFTWPFVFDWFCKTRLKVKVPPWFN